MEARCQAEAWNHSGTCVHMVLGCTIIRNVVYHPVCLPICCHLLLHLLCGTFMAGSPLILTKVSVTTNDNRESSVWLLDRQWSSMFQLLAQPWPILTGDGTCGVRAAVTMSANAAVSTEKSFDQYLRCMHMYSCLAASGAAAMLTDSGTVQISKRTHLSATVVAQHVLRVLKHQQHLLPRTPLPQPLLYSFPCGGLWQGHSLQQQQLSSEAVPQPSHGYQHAAMPLN
jgi:hypothetical protein